jgi:hypothetical protein
MQVASLREEDEALMNNMRKVTKQTTPGCGFYLSPTFASPQSNSST